MNQIYKPWFIQTLMFTFHKFKLTKSQQQQLMQNRKKTTKVQLIEILKNHKKIWLFSSLVHSTVVGYCHKNKCPPEPCTCTATREFVAMWKKLSKTPSEAIKNVKLHGRVMLQDLTSITLHIILYFNMYEEQTHLQKD